MIAAGGLPPTGLIGALARVAAEAEAEQAGA